MININSFEPELSKSIFHKFYKIFKTSFLIKPINFFVFIYIIGVSVLSFKLRGEIPINAAINAPHDDLLAVRIAKNLILGEALGTWNVNTFAKPPAFSFYLFLINKIDLDYIIINHLLYLIASLALSLKICELLFGKKTFKNYFLLIFTYMTFVPTVYQTAFSKVYRSTLTFLLILLILYLLMQMWSLVLKKRLLKSKESIILNWVYISICSIFLGFSYATLILTRAESYWVVIALYVSLFIFLVFDKNKSQVFIVSIVVSVIALLSFNISINSVKNLSERIYGYGVTENFYGNNFSRAINLWSSVYVKEDNVYHVTVNKEKREIVYSISSSASKLKPFLETEPNSGWKIQSCQRNNICDESASWFPWELRDAAVQAEEIKNEKEFQIFFKKLGDEIEEKCTNETVKCGKLGAAPGSRNILDLPKSRILEYSFNGFLSLFSYPSGANIAFPDSAPGVTPDIVKEFREVVNYGNVTQNVNSTPVYTSKILGYQVGIYQILNILIISVLFPFIFRRKFLKKIGPLIFFLITSLGLNLLGLSVFEISLGFTPGLDLYLLPIYPIFHVAIAICLIAPLEYLHSLRMKKRLI